MTRILLVYFIFLGFQLKAQNQADSIFEEQFSVGQLQEDFNLFKTALEKIHPGLYRYTSKSEMDSIFDLVYNSLDQPMAYEDFYKLLALVNSHIHCQHTAVSPGHEDIERISQYGKMFPYEIFWEFDAVKAYALSDLTNQGGIMPGTQILKINGKPVQAVYDTLMKYLFADGYNITSKQVRLIPFDFQYWYYFFIDRPDTFEIDFLKDGKILNKRVAALTRGAYKANVKKYIKKDNPEIKRILDYYLPKQKLKPYRLEFLNKSTALLTLKEFGSLKFIHKSFRKIKREKIENLIIDVRNNEGGYDWFGYTLFSYLIDKPTAYYDSIYATVSDIEFLLKHTDKDSAWLKATEPLVYKLNDGRLATKPEANKGLLMQQPRENRFDGKVYVLMNGKSMSTTAEFTAATHYHKLATFIGEESGGAYQGGNGGDFATLTLPNSQLIVNIPLAKYEMAIPSDRFQGHGTIPDYVIKTTVKDFLELKDPQLEFALKLIKKSN